MTDEQLLKIIKKHCPVNLSYRQDGGLLDPCKIEGTLGDVLDFVKAIYTEGFYDAELDGYNEGVDMIVDAHSLYEVADELEVL